MARRPWLGLALAVLAACGGGQHDRPPAPRGTPYGDYLNGDGPAPRKPPGTDELEVMRLHLIDVGQGTAALIELPCGAILVDTGGELNPRFDGVARLRAYLDGFFARRGDLKKTLALLAVSHPHLDHTRGIAMVLGRYQVANVIDNGDVREEPGGFEQLALHAWLDQHPEVGHADIAAGEIGPTGMTSTVIDPIGPCVDGGLDPEVRVLWGGPLGRQEVGQDPNDDSVVVRVELGEASFLLTGDLERLALARILDKYEGSPLLDADVMVVPHHGSKHSTAEAFDRAVSPDVALISSGPYERSLGTPEEYTARAFGHPSRAAVDDLLAAGVGLRRTPPASVMLGVRGRWQETPSEFVAARVDRAIYATGWDGTIVVAAYANGWLDVVTRQR